MDWKAYVIRRKVKLTIFTLLVFLSIWSLGGWKEIQLHPYSDLSEVQLLAYMILNWPAVIIGLLFGGIVTQNLTVVSSYVVTFLYVTAALSVAIWLYLISSLAELSFSSVRGLLSNIRKKEVAKYP